MIRNGEVKPEWNGHRHHVSMMPDGSVALISDLPGVIDIQVDEALEDSEITEKQHGDLLAAKALGGKQLEREARKLLDKGKTT